MEGHDVTSAKRGHTPQRSPPADLACVGTRLECAINERHLNSYLSSSYDCGAGYVYGWSAHSA